MSYETTIARYTEFHEQTRCGYLPEDLARACEAWYLLRPQLNPGQRVLDCSAGRGVLLRLLVPYDIHCTATEADPYLITHELAAYDPRYLRYDQLAQLQPHKWDAVVSMNVLQHLETVEEIAAALRDMAALSARWLCVCVDLSPSSWVGPRGEMVALHHILEPPEWWYEQVGGVATITRAYKYHTSYFVLAEVE